MQKMKHRIVALLFLSFSLSIASRDARADEQVVNVFGWSDYIAPGVLQDFTKETGIKVVYDTYDSDATLETRLTGGKSGYDVVILSAPVLQRQIAAALLQRLDKGKLPNAGNLWPDIMARLARADPGNQYAVNYMWYTAGIAFDADKARDRLADTPLDSWDIIFKPDNLKKFGDCGVDVIDSGDDLFAIALLYLKLNPYSKNLYDLRRAENLLSTLPRNVDDFDSTGYVDALANGDICLAVGWSGDATLARNRANEADNGTDVADVVPQEGTVVALDNLAIPNDAPHVSAAYTFINFLMRPDIAARNTNATGFANGILAAKPLVDAAIANNKAIYPDDDVMQRLFVVTDHDPATERFISREWAEIKSQK